MPCALAKLPSVIQSNGGQLDAHDRIRAVFASFALPDSQYHKNELPYICRSVSCLTYRSYFSDNGYIASQQAR